MNYTGRPGLLAAGLVVFMSVGGQASAQTWQTQRQLAPGSAGSCPLAPFAYEFTLSGSDLSVKLPDGQTVRESVAPSGWVVIQYRSTRGIGGTVTITGNAGTRDLRLVNSALKGCSYLLVAATNPAALKSLNACEQTVDYALWTTGDVPSDARPLMGAWVGRWNKMNLCGALLVESIAPDGRAQVIYVHGSSPEWGIRSARNFRWNGRVSGGVLKLDKNSMGFIPEFKLVGPNDLQGYFSPHFGAFTRQ